MKDPILPVGACPVNLVPREHYLAVKNENESLIDRNFELRKHRHRLAMQRDALEKMNSRLKLALFGFATLSIVLAFV